MMTSKEIDETKIKRMFFVDEQVFWLKEIALQLAKLREDLAAERRDK